MHESDTASRPPTGNPNAGQQQADPLHTVGPSNEKENTHIRPRRILVVEDDATLAHLEAHILIAHGFEVTVAGNGEEAVDEIRQAVPDMLILDLDLPGTLNGWDVLQDLRSIALTPVLLTSAATTIRQQIHTRGESKATLDHLPKPYALPILLKRIDRMLNTASPPQYVSK